MFQQGGPGRGAKLALDLTAVNRDVFQDISGCRCGHRQDPVGAFHLAVSHVDRRCDDLIRRQLVEQQADGGDVGDGVHGADFVEVDLADQLIMRFAFSLGDETVDGEDILADGLRQFQVSYDMLDVVQAAVCVVTVCMLVFMGVSAVAVIVPVIAVFFMAMCVAVHPAIFM